MGKLDPLPLTEQHAQDEQKRRKTSFFIITSVLYLFLIILLFFILFSQISDNRKLSKSINSLKEFIETQNGIIYDQILSSSDHLENLIIDKTEDQTDKLIAAIAVTNRNLNRVERVYASLLDEQKKKTLESLYDEAIIIDSYGKAEKFFKEKKYRQAYDEFSFVSNEQPENLDAIFFKFYSLFLINKGDQSQYRIIKNSFLQLQNRGYNRPEIQDVMDFIANEENPPEQSAKEDIK